MSEGYNFNFNEDLPAPSSVAAEAVTREQLERLFNALWQANAGWNDPTRGPRGAALSALDAVAAFLAANPYNVAGAFSRPLELLRLAVANSPEPYPGEILAPSDHRQAPGREKRQAINYVKAAMIFAVDRLHETGIKLDPALTAVANTAIAHGFVFGNTRPADETIKSWRTASRNGSNGPARFLRSLQTASPIRSPVGSPMRKQDVLSWLASELKQAGFDKKIDR